MKRPSLDTGRLTEALAPAAEWTYLGVLLALRRMERTDPADRARVLDEVSELCAAGADHERARIEKDPGDGRP